MPMIRGSTPALAQPRIFALGVSPRARAVSADDDRVVWTGLKAGPYVTTHAEEHRRDFAREISSVDRRFRLALAVEGKRIGLVARDAVLPSEDLSRLADD